MYSTRTVPGLCSRGPIEPPNTIAQSAYQKQLISLSWNVFCGKLSDHTSTLLWGWSAAVNLSPSATPATAVTAAHNASSPGSTSTPTAAAGVASQTIGSYVMKLAVQILRVSTIPLLAAAAVGLRAVRLVGQGLVVYFGAGFLSGDPFHLVLPPLRLLALLLPLLPLPLPNLLYPFKTTSSSSAAAGFRRTSSSTGSTHHTDLAAAAASSSSSSIVWYRPSYYWQYPKIRSAAIVLQRLLPCIAAATCVGHMRSVCFELNGSDLGYWQGLWKYVFHGWVAAMLVLPMHIHIPVMICEWILMYATTMQILHSSSSSSAAAAADLGFSQWLEPYHLITSLFFVVLIPTGVLVMYQISSRRQYQALLESNGGSCSAAAAAAPPPWQQQQGLLLDGNTNEGRNCTSSSGSSSNFLPNTASRNDQLLADINSSLAAAAAAHQGPPSAILDRRSRRGFSELQDGPAAAANGSSMDGSSRYPAVLNPAVADGVQLLLADEAAAVFQAAAAANERGSRNPWTYRSMAQSLPVSIKVHTDHSNVALLEPLLNDTLLHQLNNTPNTNNRYNRFHAVNGYALNGYTALSADAANSRNTNLRNGRNGYAAAVNGRNGYQAHPQYNSAGLSANGVYSNAINSSWGLVSPQIQSVCFPGCVQLIANILALRRPAAAAGSSDAAAAGEGAAGVDRSSSRGRQKEVVSCHAEPDFAAALLSRVRSVLRHTGVVACEADTPAAAAAAAAARLAAVAAAVAAGSAAEEDHRDITPQVDVVVGSAVASSAAAAAAAKCPSTGSSSSSSARSISRFDVRCCEPVCLTAGRVGHVTLHLNICVTGVKQDSSRSASAAAAAAATAGFRVIVFGQGNVVVDQQVKLLNGQIRFKVPAQPAGVRQVALLPAAAAAAEAKLDAAAVPPARLLLLPLLVLPKPAAQELQHYHEQGAAAAAAAAKGLDQPGCCTAAAAAAAWQSVSQITIDIAYLLPAIAAFKISSKCSATAASSSSRNKSDCALPDPMRAVLVHLLKHLAASGMLTLLQFVVEWPGHSSTAPSPDYTSLSSSSSSSGGGGRRSTKITAASVQAAAAAVPQPDPAASTSAASSTSSGSSSARSVTRSEFLWGFKSPDLESAYQAITFSTTVTLDIISLVYTIAMGLACCFAEPGLADQAWLQNLARIWGVGHYRKILNPNNMLFSHVVTMIISVAGPLSVLVLRVWVARTLRSAAAAAEAAQQQQTKPGSSSSSSSPFAQIVNQQQQQAAAAALLAQASRIKQNLLAIWILLIHCNVITGITCPGWLLNPPVMIIRAWAVSGWAQGIGGAVGLALKAWTAQLPLVWLVPLMTSETLLNVCSSITFGDQPLSKLLLLVYGPALLLAVAVGALQHIQGRRQFCARRGIAVGG